MNISELNNKTKGEWINEFTGSVSSASNKQAGNGTISKCVLSDGDASIHVETWDHDLHRYEGKTIAFKGKGAVIDEYNGKVFLKLLKAARLSVVDQASPPPDLPPPSAYKPQPKQSLESLASEYGDKLFAGYGVATTLEADLSVELSSEDKRAIAISFVIEANRKGL
jgi:hypothetical protein